MIDTEQVIEGGLIEGTEEPLVCDATNYEFLLRLKRARATPPFEPRPLTDLVPFLAREQDLVDQGDDLTAFTECLDRLLLHPAPAGLWESRCSLEVNRARFGVIPDVRHVTLYRKYG